MNEKLELILNEVHSQLTESDPFFDVAHSETLVEEEDQLTVLISIEPKSNLEFEDSRVEGKTQHLEFTITDDNDISLIIGEDTEVAVSRGNIFACLYWGEVVKELS